MTKDQLRDAVAEARRFIRAAERCKFQTFAIEEVQPGKYAAAVKRASLDLSMALAKMRGRSQ